MAHCTTRNQCAEGAHPGDYSLANYIDWFVTTGGDPHTETPEGFFDPRTLHTHCPHPELDNQESRQKPAHVNSGTCLGSVARTRPGYVISSALCENRHFLPSIAGGARSTGAAAYACPSANYPHEPQFLIGLSSGSHAC